MGAVLGIRHQKAAGGVSPRWVFFLCISCFCLGVFVVNRFWTVEPVKENENASFEGYPKRVSKDKISCEKMETSTRAGDILNQVSQAQDVIMTLDKTISSLEMQLAAARAVQESNQDKSPVVRPAMDLPKDRPKVFFVMGIMTAFSSRKRRDSIRNTWMSKGEKLQKSEKEKGIIMRFVIGHSATPGGVVERATDAEIEQHKDFLRLICFLI